MLDDYLKNLSEQQFGVPPKKPTQRPQSGSKPSMKRLQPKNPKQPSNPTDPKTLREKQYSKKDLKPDNPASPKAYFNYMVWTSKIIKQGEIFKRNCYQQNCDEFEVGTGQRRICKNRCDIEGYKKIIALLRTSMGKCSQSSNPEKCKVRYMQLIPLYQQKLNILSKKFIEAEKRQKRSQTKVG